MIVHVSMPADDCEKVARALAAMMDGGALPFPPGGPNAWNAWSKSADTQIVVTPRGGYMVRGETEMQWDTRPTRERASETHFALCVPRAAHEVLTIARQHGWPAQVCNRGGFFHVVEIWIEGAYLVEVLDPACTEEYRRSMTVDNWIEHFGDGKAALSP